MAATTLIAASTIVGVQDSSPQSTQPVSLAAQVRTLKGIIPWSITETMNGSVCGEATSNTCTNMDYPVFSGESGLATGTKTLNETLRKASAPVIILGYSQGAVVASRWLSQHAADADAPSADKVSFIFNGNPKRKYGGTGSVYATDAKTPSTQYTVLDVAREYDGIADLPDDPWNFLAVANAFAGYFLVHTAYTNVDLVKDDKLVWKEGNTTYVLMRTQDLPLLAGWRLMGLGFVADALNGPLKKIIDAGYHRNYPGIISDPAAAQQAVDAALHGPPAVTPAPAPTPTPTPISPKRPTELALAAAKTAAALVSTQRLEKLSPPADTDTQPETEPKTIAAESPSVDAPEADDPEVTQVKSESTHAEQAEAAEAGGDDAEQVGRHRAPEAAPEAAPTASPSTTGPDSHDAKPSTESGASDSAA